MKVVNEDKTIIRMKILKSRCPFQGEQWQDKICAHLKHNDGVFMNYKFEVAPSRRFQKTPKNIYSKSFIQTMNFGDGSQPMNCKALEVLMEIINIYFFKSPL
jgi:hypothetical protein